MPLPVWDPVEQDNAQIGDTITAIEDFLNSLRGEVPAIEEGGSALLALICLDLPYAFLFVLGVGLIFLTLFVLSWIKRNAPNIPGIDIGSWLNGPISFVEGIGNDLAGRANGHAHHAQYSFRNAVFGLVPGLDWGHLPAFLSWVSNTLQDVYDTLKNHGVQIAQIRGQSQRSLSDLENDLNHLAARIAGYEGTLTAFETFLPTLTHEIAHWKSTLETMHRYNLERDSQIHRLYKYSDKVGADLSWLNQTLIGLIQVYYADRATRNKNYAQINKSFETLWPLLALMSFVHAGSTVRTEMIAQGKDPCRCFHLEGSDGNITQLISLYDFFVHG